MSISLAYICVHVDQSDNVIKEQNVQKKRTPLSYLEEDAQVATKKYVRNKCATSAVKLK